jgi:phosphoribosyl 1,2-cyclic phosphate phosphodiesterase
LCIKPHPAHFNYNQVLKIIDVIKPKKTILTNLHSDLDYNKLLKNTPINVKPAFDGLQIKL